MKRWTRLFLILPIAFLATGCPDEGPAEEAGEAVDEAADDVGDAVDEVEDAVDEVEDAVDGQ